MTSATDTFARLEMALMLLATLTFDGEILAGTVNSGMDYVKFTVGKPGAK